MDSERTLGPTFAAADIGWIDFESRSALNLGKAGSVRYACDESTSAIVCAYAIGNGRVETVERFEGLSWTNMSPAFKSHHARVRKGKAIWAAWNAGFDRAIWNYATDFPALNPTHIIDPMVQAAAAGLPFDLYFASRVVQAPQAKLKEGRRLIRMFSDMLSDTASTPEDSPEDWQAFLNYARIDIEAMRSVFRNTLQLSKAEWCEYWAMEQVNARGVAIDLPMVEHAAKLAKQDRLEMNAELLDMTAGQLKSIDQVAVMTQWILAQFPLGKAGEDGVKILTKRAVELDEDGNETRPAKYSLQRRQVERALAWIKTLPKKVGFSPLDKAERMLQLRLYGGSRTPAKFAKMLLQHVDGRLYNQYTFNGAGQTGRASSRGVQIHNLTRDALPYEHEAVEALLDGCDYQTFSEIGDLTPVSRKLSLLIRPAFVPEDGHSFVWSDWSNIEARVLPWLAGETIGAKKRLQLFLDTDANPKLPDLYTQTAAQISDIPMFSVTKQIRQRGKVAELALGFGGGVGSLQAMGAGYGIHFDDAAARRIVDRWRHVNAWAVQFWGRHDEYCSEGLWGAINRALIEPGSVHRAGRIHYCFKSDYLDGSLLCVLPSGRVLTYRKIYYESVPDLDEDDNVIGHTTHLRFSRGTARVKLWPGLACLAAGTLVLTESGWMPIEQITNERVWDGDAWVSHDGVVCNGLRNTIDLDGVLLTPDHQVLTTEGWKDAARIRHNRAPVRLPNGYSMRSQRQWPRLVDTLRLRQRIADAGQVLQQRGIQILRLQKSVPYGENNAGKYTQLDARDDASSGLCCLALDASTMSELFKSGVAQLRGAGHRCMSAMVRQFRIFLGRHGANVSRWIGDRTDRQYGELRTRQLCLGYTERTGPQQADQCFNQYAMGQNDGVGGSGAQRHKTDDFALSLQTIIRPVYDILNAGLKHQFIVATKTGPLIVHNCENVVQAVAADVLRGTLRRLEDLSDNVRLHTHDEIVLEVPDDAAALVASSLHEIMCRGFDWSDGLPLMSQETISPYYTKLEIEHAPRDGIHADTPDVGRAASPAVSRG